MSPAKSSGMILPLPIWSSAPPQLRLQAGEIHLWRAHLADSTRVEACERTLSAEERLRAGRFAFAEDRQHFIIAHAALRTVLARYVGGEAAELEFTTGEFGKPQVVQLFTDVRFNLSHTDGLALIAVSLGREVGVDVERVNRDIEYEEIADHYFDPREAWDLRIAPPQERACRFFEVWTRKEACLKASGAGLGGEIEPRWNVRNLQPAEGYAGALASEGEDWRLACWEWSL